MACSKLRTGILSLSALLFLAVGTARAGELLRPVPPDAQVTRFTRFNLRYSLRDVVADSVQKVEFYITEDMGRTWRLYGEDPDRTSPMTVEVPGEGVYGFVCVVTDRFGNREREPVARTRPETVIVVDRTPPQAKWIAPTQNILGRGRPLELTWETSDPYFGPSPVKIQYSSDARSNRDPNAVWNTLQENLSASGSINWTPPEGVSAQYHFRLIAEDRAGNLTVAYNPATVTVDTTPPVIVSVSPLRSNKLQNNIVVDANDGGNGSGVMEVSLYTYDSKDGYWVLLKETTATGESVPIKRGAGQGIPFTAPRSGNYGLWPVVFDNAGNATPLPSAGAMGPYVLTIDTEPPIVSLSNSFLMGRAAVLSNETRRVEWTGYDPHIQNNSAVISISLDNGNTWQELRSGLPASGSEIINFPFGAQSEDAKLRVTVADEFGNIGESISETFKLSGAQTVIDSVTPVTPSGSPAGGYGVAASGDGGTPPYISPPPATPSGSNYPYPVTPVYPDATLPPAASGAPSTPTFDPYAPSATYDPYAAPAPMTPTTPTMPYSGIQSPYDASASSVVPYTPPTATDPYAASGGLYASPSPSMAMGPVTGESTAGSLPRAMIGTVSTPQSAPASPPSSFGGIQAPPLSSMPSQPSLSAPTSPVAPSAPTQGWNPSPGAGTPSAAPSAPASPSSSPFASPATPGMTGIPPMPSAPTTGSAPASGIQAPPASFPPAAPAAPATGQPAFGSDWPALGGELTPPQIPSSSSQAPQLPPPGAGLSLDDLAGDLSMPPLPGASANAPAIPPVPAAPPSGNTASAAPAAGGLRPPGAATGTPPATPAAPQPAIPATPLVAPPAQPAPLPRFDDGMLTPPPLGAPQSGRPTNPRQLSEYQAGQARSYLDEGNLDLAMRSATESLNADDTNPKAYMILSQVYAQQDPKVNNFARAATLAKEATNLGRDWESWWNCADVFYRWAHRRNMDIQAMLASGQRPPVDVTDERNQALSNAQVAIGNSSSLARQASADERKKVATTQGLIAYLRALTIPDPTPPTADTAAAQDEYRRAQAAYKASAAPLLMDALPYFRTARDLGAPAYSETFHLGIINFRLAGLEKAAGNTAQAANFYQEAARYLEEATTARDTPTGGPREAYYMLAYCYDLMSDQAGPNRARNKELALRYWRQTANFYSPGTAYRDFAEQRIEALSAELGQ